MEKVFVHLIKHNMGNCIACHSQLKKQNKGPLAEGRGIAVDDASVPVEKMSPASSKHYIMVRKKLQNGEEVYHLVPFRKQSVDPLVPCGTNDDNRKMTTRNVKIVVTSEQLELLLSGSKELQIRSRVARVRESCAPRGCRKWLPSLPTIQEVENY